jgi:hypothetical protein
MPTSAYAVCTNPMPQEKGIDACLHEAVGEGRDDGRDVETGSPGRGSSGAPVQGLASRAPAQRCRAGRWRRKRT